MIVGVQYYNQIMLSKPFVRYDNLAFYETHFGWLVLGSSDPNPTTPINFSSVNSTIFSCCFKSDPVSINDVNDQLQKFWQLEEPLATDSTENKEYQLALETFNNSVTRDATGQFHVRYPLKEDKKEICNNRERALRAFLKIEKAYDAETWTEYVKFMQEYQELHHMSVVPAKEVNQPSYYIPHRAILRLNAYTTKLRVVFNGSSLDGKGLSMNSACLKCPKTQPELFDILLNFRMYRYAFCTDIEKMYRQVRIHREDQDLQRILWRPSPDEPICDFRLEMVIYGLVPSGFLATSCLNLLKNATNDPAASRLIKKSFYMDDLLAGADTEDEVILIQAELHEVLKSAKFPLRKYTTNSSALAV